MQRLKRPALALSFLLCLTTFVIYRRYEALAHHSEMPISVDFCDLAKNREKFWDTKFTTLALVGHSLEGGELISPACPSVFLSYQLEDTGTTEKVRTQSIFGPFNPDIWIKFEGDLTTGSRRADSYHRLLRAFGIPTKGIGVVRILKVASSAGGPDLDDDNIPR